MNKFLSVICAVCLSVLSVSAQNTDRTGKVNESSVSMKAKMKGGNLILKDETELLNITGVNSSVFTVSNMSDGTEKSFNHDLRIILSLNTAENKNEKYQLVFYGSQDKIPFAVANEITAFSIYYPIAMYESIRENLDRSLASKKKIQLKLTRKTDGYREGTLIF